MIIVWYGSTVVAWRNQGLAENPEHSNVKALIETPIHTSDDMLNSRMPHPTLTVCDQGGSQARFLLSRLNPSKTYREGENAMGQFRDTSPQGETILTDDVNMQVFISHLKRVISGTQQ
ncbi:hypothetical protein KIPB_000065 [Kipferlia bialata]|uniref:Protein transport protein SEC23 n=1 Tax=Kipferlia bialata TaxID=797122 RepID=A0A9K3CN78_9EUKA|nr:hypothetical protein KIPB_000065 [Kipferlia bialata]|eukprot:g65.t1